MTYRVLLLPRAEEDLHDDVPSLALRDRILDALGRAAQDPLSAQYFPEHSARILSFYVAGSRGPIIVHADIHVHGDTVRVGSIAFEDEGNSLGRPSPFAL